MPIKSAPYPPEFLQPQPPRNRWKNNRRSLVIVGSIIAGCLFLGLILRLASQSAAYSGPSFNCAITANSDGSWNANVTVTGPTVPGIPLMNVSIVYYDQAGNEIGSNGIVPVGPFGGVVVPAGQSVTYSGVDSGSAPAPASCQATEAP